MTWRQAITRIYDPVQRNIYYAMIQKNQHDDYTHRCDQISSLHLSVYQNIDCSDTVAHVFSENIHRMSPPCSTRQQAYSVAGHVMRLA